MTEKQVILYGYPLSPNSQKVATILALKKIPFKLVEVSPQPPRPELEKLGISYRRMPVLVLGGKILCDTALIFRELEKEFKPQDGHPSLFPDNASSMVPFLSSVSISHIDKGFEGVLSLLPLAIWQNEALRKDREEFFGRQLKLEEVKSQFALGMFNLKSRFEMIEAQLKSSLKDSKSTSEIYLLGTQSPSLIDIYYHYHLFWIDDLCQKAEPESEVSGFFNSLPQRYPLSSKWIQDLHRRIESSRDGDISFKDDPLGGIKIHADQAFKMIVERKISEWSFNEEDDLIKAQSIGKGVHVQVTPIDTGKVPQVGKLVGLSFESSTLRVDTADGHEIQVSFPRQGYSITKA